MGMSHGTLLWKTLPVLKKATSTRTVKQGGKKKKKEVKQPFLCMTWQFHSLQSSKRTENLPLSKDLSKKAHSSLICNYKKMETTQ